MNTSRSWISWGTFSLSASLHGLLLAMPAEIDLPHFEPEPKSLVEFAVVAPPPPQEPEPIAEVEERPKDAPPVEPVAEKPEAPEPEPEPPASEPEPPEDPTRAAPPEAPQSEAPPQELTGTTLTAEGPGDFAVERGSGSDRRGAIVAGVSQPVGRRTITRKPVSGARLRPKEPLVESLKDLLRRPAPPDLAAALRRNYPSSARAQGKSGDAKVRARIEPDGSIVVTRLVSESAAGFGSSCIATLEQSRWTPPLGSSGKPVATWVSYRCQFVVDD